MALVAIDPGLRGTGVAVFEDGLLVEAAYPRNPELILRGPAAWLAMARAVLDSLTHPLPCDLVIEVPQVYVAGRGKGDPDDLLELAGVDGAITALLGPTTTRSPKPREWKGQVPKEIHHARALRKLSPPETVVLEQTKVPPSLRHNVLDAVALGLWALKR